MGPLGLSLRHDVFVDLDMQVQKYGNTRQEVTEANESRRGRDRRVAEAQVAITRNVETKSNKAQERPQNQSRAEERRWWCEVKVKDRGGEKPVW